MDAITAQVEKAVLQANVFGIVLLAKNRQRQFASLGLNLHLINADFNFTRCEVFVDSVARARDDTAGESRHEFGPQSVNCLESRTVGFHHALGQAVVVAQIDEDQPTMIAPAMNPAGNAGTAAHAGGAQFAAGMGAIAMH